MGKSNESGGLERAEKRKILIIQGDWEGGMSRLSLDLMDAGHEAGKVQFCVPDAIYRLRGIPLHPYRGKIAEFETWLRDLVREKGYDTFFLYNHHRPYNRIAWKLAIELDLRCHVFELGLIRPNCVTVFDRDSLPLPTLSRAWTDLQNGGPKPEAPEKPRQLDRIRTGTKLTAFCINFLISRLTWPLYPNFVDQREMKLGKHLKHGALHAWRFLKRRGDRSMDSVFASEWSGSYYAVPLQVHCDTQITACSDFRSIEEFIDLVIASFEIHSPAGSRLVFKVHPMDRGYKDYRERIAAHDRRLGGGRLFYVDRVHLPTLLTHSRGVVTINSSVGLSGLIHGAPVIPLGRAVYHLPELTFHGPLDAFWQGGVKPSDHRVKQFVNLLLQTSQGRGALSQRCFDVPGRCGIKWPPPFQSELFDIHPEETEGNPDVDAACFQTADLLLETGVRF